MRRARFQLCGNFKQTYEEEFAVFETDFGRLWTLIGLLFLFGILPFTAGPGMLHMVNAMGIYAIAAMGLNLLVGFTGLISLAHGGLFGIGAYCGALLASKAGLPFFLVLPAAGLAAAAVGMLIALPALRLRRRVYLPLVTLAGQIIIGYLMMEGSGATGGAEGLSLAGTGAVGLILTNSRVFYFVVLFLNAVLLWLLVNLMRSKYGRAFLAIRGDEQTAEERGIPAFRYKMLSFSLSAFFTGIAGALYAYFMIVLTPERFGFWSSVELIAVIVVGGLGTLKGSFFGAIFFVLLQSVIGYLGRFLPGHELFAGVLTVSAIREVAIGLEIIIFILFIPNGLAAGWNRISSVLRRWPFPR